MSETWRKIIFNYDLFTICLSVSLRNEKSHKAHFGIAMFVFSKRRLIRFLGFLASELSVQKCLKHQCLIDFIDIKPCHNIYV